MWIYETFRFIPQGVKLSLAVCPDIHDFRRLKLSENTEKVTNPGNKTINRVYEKDTHKIKADLICLTDETFDETEPMLSFVMAAHFLLTNAVSRSESAFAITRRLVGCMDI